MATDTCMEHSINSYFGSTATRGRNTLRMSPVMSAATRGGKAAEWGQGWGEMGQGGGGPEEGRLQDKMNPAAVMCTRPYPPLWQLLHPFFLLRHRAGRAPRRPTAEWGSYGGGFKSPPPPIPSPPTGYSSLFLSTVVLYSGVGLVF